MSNRCKNIVNVYLKGKDIDVIDEEFDYNNTIKNLIAIDDKIDKIVEEYDPKKRVGTEDKKRVISILNIIRNNLLDYYLDPNTIVELHKKYQHNKMDNVLNKYSKDSSSIDQIIDKIETYRNTKNHSRKKILLKE